MTSFPVDSFSDFFRFGSKIVEPSGAKRRKTISSHFETVLVTLCSRLKCTPRPPLRINSLMSTRPSIISNNRSTIGQRQIANNKIHPRLRLQRLHRTRPPRQLLYISTRRRRIKPTQRSAISSNYRLVTLKIGSLEHVCITCFL